MQIDFFKYQGAGNDFVVLDNMGGSFDNLKPEHVASLCDRRFGIGADGLLLLSKSVAFLLRFRWNITIRMAAVPLFVATGQDVSAHLLFSVALCAPALSSLS